MRARTPAAGRLGRLWAVATVIVLGTLSLQAALPAAHALELGRLVGAAGRAPASDARVRPADVPALARADRTLPAHDPATCPVCQLLHATPGLPLPAAVEHGLAGPAARLATPLERVRARPARSGHPPRAPPLRPPAFA